MKRYSSIILAAFLLLGQINLITHQLDINAHQSGELCHVCLHASPLDSAAVSGIDVVPDLTLNDAEPASFQASVVFRQLPVQHARAPPAPIFS